jgi:hypothetical protein
MLPRPRAAAKPPRADPARQAASATQKKRGAGAPLHPPADGSGWRSFLVTCLTASGSVRCRRCVAGLRCEMALQDCVAAGPCRTALPDGVAGCVAAIALRRCVASWRCDGALRGALRSMSPSMRCLPCVACPALPRCVAPVRCLAALPPCVAFLPCDPALPYGIAFLRCLSALPSRVARLRCAAALPRSGPPFLKSVSD